MSINIIEWAREHERDERARDAEFSALTQALQLQVDRMVWVHVELGVGMSLVIIGVALWAWMWSNVHEIASIFVIMVCVGTVMLWHGSYRHALVLRFMRRREQAVLDWLRMNGGTERAR